MKRELTRRAARGTAMVEFVMVLPFLAVLLGLTMFFGWAMMHKQQVVVANRYAAWHRITASSWPSEQDLNNSFFAGKANDVDLSSGEPVTETALDLIGQAGVQSPRSGDLADELVGQVYPPGDHARVSAAFDPRQALWQNYRGHIHSHSGKEGITWRREEVECWTTLRNQYYEELDESLQGVPAPGNGMAQMIRGLYLTRW